MPPPGYFGRYLVVDLSSGDSSHPTLSPTLLRQMIGGVGLGTALLVRHTRAGFDPLGEEACLVFAFSPLVGTPITTSAKLAVVSKSPLTQRLNDALSSSDFAIAGKRSGHDAIVLRGRAAEPSVVLIDHDEVRIAACPELWGTGAAISEVDRSLSELHPGFSFAIIGAAGERQVRYASLTNGLRHAGRGGLGAVLGSMRVKAVGVRGALPVALADAARVVAIARDLAARSLGPATAKYRELGTVANLASFNRLAALPTRNFQASTFEGAEQISGEQLHLTRSRGRSACRNCTIGCEHFFATKSGSRVKLEYESLFALGSLCGIDDPDVTLRAAERCDDLGLDTVSTGGTIAFAMECAERGLFSGTPWQKDSEGLRFGDGARLLALIDDIGLERSALGRLLALGSREAAERIGPPAPDFAPHVKGMELPGYEPRALQTMALGFAVGSRGADHNRSGAYEVDFSNRVDRFAPTPAAALLAIETEDQAALIDSLILCKFLRGVFDDLYLESADALTAITGQPITADELRASAARIVLAKKLFNVREGWSRAEDRLPKRFLSERLPSGVAQGVRIDADRLEALIAAYYEARGFARDGSVPPEQVRRAGLVELFSGDAFASG
jgi:aldehyde:ferredoxin oxidoreductase